MAFGDPSIQESPEQQLKRLIGIASQPVPEAPANVPTSAPPSVPPVAGGLTPSAPASSPTPVVATPNQSSLAVKPANQTQMRQAADEANLKRYQDTGSGVDQYRTGKDAYGNPIAGKHAHPILGTVAKIGDAALSSLFPSVAMNVPGTELHHQELVGQARHAVDKDVAEQHTEAQTAVAGGVGKTPEEQAFGSLLSQINPDTGKLYTPMEAFNKVGIAKQDVKPDAKPDVIETAQGPLQFNPDTKQWEPVSVGGKPVGPKEGKEGDFEKFYSDYLKDNNLPDSAHNRMRARTEYAKAGNPYGAQHLAIDIKNQSDREAAASDKKNKPYQDILDQVNEAKDFAATPSPTNDFGLLMAFVGVTKPESVGKIRFNQQELRTVVGTRSSLGDVQALEEKLSNGQMLTPQQRKDMIGTMEIIERHAQERVGGGGAAGGSISYKEGNDVYQIPPGKEEAFKAKHPGAVKQ